MRESNLSSDAMWFHGAMSDDVRSIMSLTACSYAGHFLRLRQSSAD